VTPERRFELRAIARAHAFDAAFGATPMLTALARAWVNARTRTEGQTVVRMFLHVYPSYARRSARALVRLTLREISQ
jgi:hypothetical protein